jgi:4-hydroxy-tetrahydrodipicolinate synthase
VAANWAPAPFAEMIAAHEKGDVVGARAVNARLLASYAFENSARAPNPQPAKAALRALGQRVGQCRLPLGPAPDGLDQEAREVLAALG